MNLKPASAETIARILGECTVTAGGFKCKCPAHDDKQASLQINIVGSRDGKTTVHCYAGCKPVDVFKAIEEKTGYYFESRVKKSVDTGKDDVVYPAPIDWPVGLSYNGIPHSVAYPYYDSEHQLMFVVARWNLPGGGKRILPYSVTNTGGQHKWVSKLRLTPRPIFNLAEVLEFNTKPIIIVEGEKAVEAGKHDHQFDDYVIVTYQGGAGNWKHTDWSPIKGRDLYLIPDNDDAGREAFVELAQHLNLNEFCKTVKLAEHPKYFPPKWDIADPWPENASLKHLSWYDAPKAGFDFIKSTITPANYPDVFNSLYWVLYDGQFYYTIEKQRWIHSAGRYFDPIRMRVSANHPMSRACFIGKESAIQVWANQAAHDDKFISGFRFRPGQNEPEIREDDRTYVNTFTGFGIKPDMSGNCDIIKNYLLHVICDGDENGYTYLFNYLSHMLQFPEDRPTVAIVLRGIQGAGKSAFGFLIGRLLGSSRESQGYFTSVATIDRLTGKFNSQLANKLAIFVEELELTKSRSMENALKSLVTDPTITIEPKGKEPYIEQNYARIFGASNHNHIWNVSEGERRLTLFNVSETRAGDTEYFFNLFAAFNDVSTMRRFMHELLTYKVDHVMVRKPLKNEARAFQVLATKTPNKELAYRMLKHGEISLRILDERREVVASYYVSREEWESGLAKIPSGLTRKIIQSEVETGQYGETVFSARDKRVSITEMVKMMGWVKPDDGAGYSTVQIFEHGQKKPDAGYPLPNLTKSRQAFCAYHGVNYQDAFGDADENIIPFPKAKSTASEPPF